MAIGLLVIVLHLGRTPPAHADEEAHFCVHSWRPPARSLVVVADLLESFSASEMGVSGKSGNSENAATPWVNAFPRPTLYLGDPNLTG